MPGGRRVRTRAGRAAALASALGAIACVAWPVAGHEAITTELTWTRDVSRIVHRRCAGCHRAGGAAPMPLTTYDEARPWAAAIKHEVLTRRMPPWGAVKGFGAFRNDASLSLPEIAVLSSWVQGGAPEGDPLYFEPFHAHEEGAGAEQPADARMSIRGQALLDRSLVATGVSVAPDPGSPWLQLTAHLPGGAVEHLLWLRGERPAAPMDYWFLRRTELPSGTRLRCEPASAAVELRYSRPASDSPAPQR